MVTEISVPESDKAVWLAPVEFLNKVVNLHFIAWSTWLEAIQDANRWKQREFAHTTIRKFLDDASVKNALLMMDWRERIIVLSPEQAVFLGEPKFTYHEDSLPNTLSVKPSFSLEETIVRDCFDAFFTGIEQFADLAESGMMEYADFKPYLGYWAEVLSGKVPHKNPAALAAIDGYVAEYFDSSKIRKFLDAVQTPAS